MDVHWHHPELFSEDERTAAHRRIDELARDHTDLTDVRISAHPSTHHRRGAQEVRVTCEARGGQIVAARTQSDMGLALTKSLDAFEREVWRTRQRRSARRRA
jgi:ribosome-associated translation inhibitor RaiA